MNGQGRHAEALTVIERAIDLPCVGPNERENMQAFRAELLIELGRLHEALAAINASLVSDPSEPERLLARGKILHVLGHHEQATAVLLRVLQIRPGSQSTRRLLARVKRALGARPN